MRYLGGRSNTELEYCLRNLPDGVAQRPMQYRMGYYAHSHYFNWITPRWTLSKILTCRRQLWPRPGKIQLSLLLITNHLSNFFLQQNMTLYSESKPKHSDVNGSPEQVYKMDSEALLKLFKGGNVASIMSISGKGKLQHLFCPQELSDLTGTHTKGFLGNISNNMGDFGLVSIDFEDNPCFAVIIEKGQIPDESLFEKEKLPQAALSDTPWDGLDVHAFLLPKYAPLYFKLLIKGHAED